MSGSLENRVPLRVWKLALLFVTTLSAYQFVWLFRTARNLRAVRNDPLTPWHWAVVPLLGPLAAIPAWQLARRLQAWREEVDGELGHSAEPVLVVLLALSAWFPCYLVVFNDELIVALLLIGCLASCLPWLALQGQINMNQWDTPTTSGIDRLQVASIVIGAVIALPVYAYVFTDYWSSRNASVLESGELVTAESGFFQVRVPADGWRRVATGHLSELSDLEFLGPDDRTWAIVYDSSDLDVDAVMAYRVKVAHEDYRSVSCRQLKSLQPESMIILGTVECNGRNAVDGHYLLTARVLRSESGIVEIVAGTSQADRNRYEMRAAQVRGFAEALEISP